VSSGQKEKQRRLFDFYSANLVLYAPPELDDHFLCPLCFRKFSRPDIEAGLLSIEHIISEALGGTLETLACVECNNDGGTEIEAHITKQLKVRDQFRGLNEEPVRGRVEIGGHRFAADIKWSQDEKNAILMFGKRKASNLASLNGASQALGEGAGPIKVEISFGYREGRPEIALLRMGYLAMFRQFGYGYVLHRNLDIVREQLQKPSERIVPNLTSGADDFTFDRVSPDEAAVVSILSTPYERRSFVVYLRLISSGRPRHFAVALPGLDSGDDLYKRWEEAGAFKQRVTTTVIPYDPIFVSDLTFAGFPHYLWKKMTA
jgi:hypothetical protein